jgi:uncharacterized protein
MMHAGFVRRFPFGLLAMIVAVMTSAAAPGEVIPPKPDRYFNDYAGVVDRAVGSQLNEQLAQFERETSTQMVVAVYRAMQSDSSVADYTQRVAQAWGVGQKAHNNGAVLFVFVDDHQMFIQTGYGLEGALPDAICFDITHNIIAPYFKKGDYTSGLRAGINAMMQAVRGEYKGTGRTDQEEQGNNSDSVPLGLIIFLVIAIIMIVVGRVRRRSGYGYSSWGGPFIGGFGGGGWSGGSGGSSGGGFSGFSGGGGSFGGGGAGSSW